MYLPLKKFTAIILTVVLLLSLCACGSGTQKIENPEQTAADSDIAGTSPDETFRAAQMAFGLELFQKCVKEGGNTLISPLSMMLALSMAANGAEQETLAEMEAVLGGTLTLFELNRYFYAYVKTLPSGENEKLYIADSIWIRDEEDRLKVEADFIQTCTDYFNAEIYKSAFDAGTVKDINQWVEKNTDGMIDTLIEDIDEETVMYLINALCFDAQWMDMYTEMDISEGIFTAIDGTVQEVEMMHSAEYQYLEDAHAVGFIKDYENGNYFFAALLPDEDMDIYDYIASLDAQKLTDIFLGAQDRKVITTLPKFASDYSISTKDILVEMGMAQAFDPNRADFSRMGSSSAGNLFIGDCLHKTYISVDERGTRAGAVSAVEVRDGAALIEDEKYVQLDRPFLYFIIDKKNNIPLFIGLMEDVEETVSKNTAKETAENDHDHMPAAEPQTVADPVSGFCGNTVTTVYLDGEAYSFWGSESVGLSAILINLDYGSEEICDCEAEFQVDTEFSADPYEVNLSKYIVRCQEGQAAITKEQAEKIADVIEAIRSGGIGRMTE